jgi:hypothetical protein
MSGRGAEEEPTVEIRFTTHARGRGLFATRAFRPGECILRERALLAAQFAANRAVVGAACAHCLRTFEMAETSLVRYLSDPARAQAAGALPLPGRDKYGAPQLDAPVRCEQCRDEIYCSVDCRDEAASHYHRYLCVAQDHSGALRELRALCAAKDELSEDAVVNPLWPMLVARMLAMERVVAEEEPAADNPAVFCHYCGQSAAEAGQLLRCSGCNAAYYCSDMCRKCDWRYHRPCSKDAPSTRVNPPRLRVFGRFAHAAPADFHALEAVHHVPSHYANSPDEQYLDAPLQCHFTSGKPEPGGAARVALWRVHLDLLRKSALYTPALDSLFTLPVYVRLWNILTLNSTGVSPQSLFLSYFFDIVRIAREDMPSVRRVVQQLRPNHLAARDASRARRERLRRRPLPAPVGHQSLVLRQRHILL